MRKTLLESLSTTDRYIQNWGLITLVVLAFCLVFSYLIHRYVCEDFHDHSLGKKSLPKIFYMLSRIFYSVFITLISIFPLLGMYGTVKGLLLLDFDGNQLASIRGNFFSALTSTAWGIIFSIAFKLIHAIVRDFIEIPISEAEKMYEKAKNLKASASQKVKA